MNTLKKCFLGMLMGAWIFVSLSLVCVNAPQAQGLEALDDFTSNKAVQSSGLNIAYPINKTTEYYPASVSFFLKGKKNYGVIGEIYFNGKSVKTLDNLLKNNIGKLKPVYILGGYFTVKGQYNIYGGVDFSLGKWNDFSLGSKVLFELDPRNLNPQGLTFIYATYHLGYGVLTGSDEILLYVSTYTGKVNLSKIDVNVLRSEAQNIIKDKTFKVGVYYSPDRTRDGLAFGIEISGKREGSITTHHRF